MAIDTEARVVFTPDDRLRTWLTLSDWSFKLAFMVSWAMFVGFTWSHAENLPYGTDDFFFGLAFLNDWHEAKTLNEHYYLLFFDTNGSITTSLRLLLLAWLGLTGHYSFVFTSCLNAFLFGLLAFELHRLYFPKASGGLLFLSGLLFCKPIYQENLFLTNGAQNLFCMLLGLWTIHSAYKVDRLRDLWKPYLLALAAAWASGNGPLVFLLVPILFWLTKPKPWAFIGLWMAGTVVFALHYATILMPAGNPALVEIVQHRPWLLLINYVYLLGGGLEFSRWMLTLEGIIGSVLLMGFGIWLMQGGARRNPQVAVFLLFVMGTVALAIAGRSIAEFNLEMTLPPRYKHFPYLFISIGLYLAGPWVRARLGSIPAFGLAGLIAVMLLTVSWHVYRYAAHTIAYENRVHRASLQEFARKQDPRVLYTLVQPEICGIILNKARRFGIYDYVAASAPKP